MRALLARRRPRSRSGSGAAARCSPIRPGDHAARLIEAAGLKGFRIGGASVSTKHANFIINHGAGAARRIWKSLIGHVRATVERVHGVALKPEVRIVGVP